MLSSTTNISNMTNLYHAQCTLKVQRIKTNAECSHSIPFVAACGIRKIHLLAAW